MIKIVSVLFALLFVVVAYDQSKVAGHLLSPPTSSQVIQIYDRHGIKVRSYAPGEGHDWIALNEVPLELRQMIILSEDKNFYHHHGIDLSSAIRSFWINVRNLDIRTGASTITQQVYRLHHHLPRTLNGKWNTIIGALKVEKKYTKEEILGHYLNAIPFGKRIVGVRRAAEVMFGKPLNELSLSEMATLAVIPRSPSYLLAPSNHEVLKKKRKSLLLEYAARYSLPRDVLEYELKTNPSIQFDRSGWDNFHFVQQILRNPDLPELIKNGRVETTLDLWLQRKVSEITQIQLKKLRTHNAHHAAVLVLDNRTGDVLSYLGSSQIDDKDDGNHYDALEARRQPGSTLKPFTYALALEDGHMLNEVLPDVPTYYRSGAGQYLPRNYDRDFTGPRLMREALANSLNLPAVYLAETLTVGRLHSFLEALGISLPKNAGHYGVGLTLGNAEVRPMELARSYTALIQGKEIVHPRFFLNGDIRKTSVPLSADTAYLIRDVLSDPVARRESFGDGNVFELPFSFSVKTGTSTDFRDNWAVGLNDSYTVLAWVGNMNQSPMKNVTGISGAGPIIADVMKVLMKNNFLSSRKVPGTLKKIPVCALSGKSPGPHCPHKKFEFVGSLTRLPEICSYHREVVVRGCLEEGDEKKVPATIYPSEYHSFYNERPLWSVKEQVAQICSQDKPEIIFEETVTEELAIKRPLPGSIFAIDPNIPSALQNLSIQLNRSVGLEEVSWKIGEKWIPQKGPSIDWPMEKGRHRIKADVKLKDGKTFETKTVEVTVL